jgi:hypothetical protein
MGACLAGAVLCAAHAMAVPWAPAAKSDDCPGFLPGVVAGTPTAPALVELSGLAASRSQPGVLWAHNDSGDSNRIFALRADGTLLAALALDGATHVDWEDIAIGPGPVPGTDYLYVADVGNNLLSRTVLTIYRVAEPAVDPGQTEVTGTLTGVDALQVMYPNVFVTNHDCETLWSDPANGDLYLVTKDTQAGQDGGMSLVHRFAAPHAPGPPVSLDLVASLNTGTGLLNLSTGGDLGPGDTGPILRTYSSALHWPRQPGQSVTDALAAPPCVLPLTFDGQGEAIAWDHEGAGYFTTSEGLLFGGVPQPLRHYARRNLRADAAGPTDWHVLIGEPVTLAVSGTGGGPLGYQWYRGTPAKSADPIPGADGAAYEIAAATFEDSGDYFCEVSDDDEVVNSPLFHVAVDAGLPVARGLLPLAAALLGLALLGARAIRTA